MLNFAHGVPSRAQRGRSAGSGGRNLADPEMAEAMIAAARHACAWFDVDGCLADFRAPAVGKAEPGTLGSSGTWILPTPRRLLLLAVIAVAAAVLLDLAAGIVDLRAQDIGLPCLKSDAIVDGKRRQPTPALIAAREMTPACREATGPAAADEAVQSTLDRLGATLTALSERQSRDMP
jgi:hypothetical protein